jgi:hypothetical protein
MLNVLPDSFNILQAIIPNNDPVGNSEILTKVYNEKQGL